MEVLGDFLCRMYLRGFNIWGNSSHWLCSENHYECLWNIVKEDGPLGGDRCVRRLQWVTGRQGVRPCSSPQGPVQDVPMFLSTRPSAKCAHVLVHLVQCKMCPCSCPLGPVQDVPMFLSTHDHSAQCALCTVYLPTEQAEKYFKIYVLICHLTYICPSLFGWKANIIFEETATFKL